MTQCRIGASACPCAGPAKKFGSRNQAGSYGILLNVTGDSAEFCAVPDPTVPGFLLPEGLAGAAQDSIGLASGRAFEPAGDFGQGHLGRQEQVDVVGHEDPGVQVIKCAFGFSVQRLFGYHLGDPWIGQPFWPLLFSIKFSIFCHECMARCWVRLQEIFSFAPRDRPPQSPVQEYWNPFAVLMRQFSSISRHWADESVYPTLVGCGGFVLS